MKPHVKGKEVIQSWHFSCHACGACCNSAPALTFEEMASYAKDFHIRLAFQSFPLKSTDTIEFPWGIHTVNSKQSAKIKENEKRLWNAVKGPDGIVMIHMFPIAKAPALAKSCPKRSEDGLCSIHERRPLMCRTVPLAPAMPEFLQGMAITAFEQWGCASKKTKEDLDPLFNGFKLVNEEYRNAWEETRHSMIRDKNMSMAVMQLMEEDFTYLPSIYEIAANHGKTASVSIAGAVIAGVIAEILPKESGTNILEDQIEVMKNMLETASNSDEIRMIKTDIEACDYSVELIESLDSRINMAISID